MRPYIQGLITFCHCFRAKYDQWALETNRGLNRNIPMASKFSSNSVRKKWWNNDKPATEYETSFRRHSSQIIELTNHLPSPRDATSVATNIAVLPSRNSAIHKIYTDWRLTGGRLLWMVKVEDFAQTKVNRLGAHPLCQVLSQWGVSPIKPTYNTIPDGQLSY